MTVQMPVAIRPVLSISEYHLCEKLQRTVWAMPDDLEVVPLHLLVTAHRNGGLLLGAFDGDDLIGFVFGFPGMTEQGQAKHCSHMMGVDPAYQGRGIGYQLKLAQRALLLEQGLELATWTYDPLESRNAYLNVHKLAAVCRTYIRDYYGPLADGLNASLPTDRLEAEWWLASERVQGCLAGKTKSLLDTSAVLVNAVQLEPTGFLAPGLLRLEIEAPLVQVEIPANYQAVKASDSGLAMEWRLVTRQILEAYLGAGYVVSGFYSKESEIGRRSYYLLSKELD
jgi:predicted GNAT superfamily acetyltransferase